MKRKVLMLIALAVVTLNFSSCIVRERGGDGHRHWHHRHHHDHGAEVIIK